MSLFSDLITNETITSVREKIVAIAQQADLLITNWISGGVGEQVVQALSIATYTASRVATKAIRGYASLDTSTDPGDVDAYDSANEGLAPAPGLLSSLGENTFGTPRREETFATGFVTFINAGTVARTFGPESLVFTWTDGTPPSPAPTYRNSADASVYTDPDGTITVAAGSDLVIPVVAEELGTRSNAPAGSLSLTTTLSGCTATNAAAVLGTDRESAADYRARCKKAPARISLGGPSAAYEYLANTTIDGDPLLNASEAEVNITRVQVSQDSDTGDVTAWFASPSGAASAEDVTAANNNIELEAFAVPDTISYTGDAAVEVPIPVTGTAKLKDGAGVSEDDAKQAIVDALTAYGATFPIGGVDQDVDGNGMLYTEDLQVVAGSAYPGLYSLAITAPAGASTALAFGRVAVLSTVPGDWTVTLV